MASSASTVRGPSRPRIIGGWSAVVVGSLGIVLGLLNVASVTDSDAQLQGYIWTVVSLVIFGLGLACFGPSKARSIAGILLAVGPPFLGLLGLGYLGIGKFRKAVLMFIGGVITAGGFVLVGLTVFGYIFKPSEPPLASRIALVVLALAYLVLAVYGLGGTVRHALRQAEPQTQELQ